MDFELTESQQNVFEKIQAGDHLDEEKSWALYYKEESNG